MRLKAISSFLLPLLGHLSNLVNSRSYVKVFEVLTTFFKNRLLPFTLIGGVGKWLMRESKSAGPAPGQGYVVGTSVCS